jgi:peptidoglycan/LPS O-acetylase OafA/YrhL
MLQTESQSIAAPSGDTKSALSQDEFAGRIRSLDSLRGVAILMVLFGHFIPLQMHLGDGAYHVTSLGRGGVVLFFLLSGYLVFRSLEKQDIVTFISRRLFKIFPAYWVNVLIIACFGVLIGKEAILPDVVFSNLFMVQDVLRKDSLSGVYWTLLIEVKFYLFLALQHLVFRDRGMLLVFAALVCINAAIWFTRGHASLLLTYFPAFYVGIQIRQAELAGWRRSAMLWIAIVSATVAASLFVFDEYYPAWSAAYILIETAALIAFLRVDLSNDVLGFFGRISYSHYLYHTVVGYAFLSALPVTPSWILNLLAVIAVIAVTTLVAFVSYRLVEVPMVSFGKRHEHLWIRRREAALP